MDLKDKVFKIWTTDPKLKKPKSILIIEHVKDDKRKKHTLKLKPDSQNSVPDNQLVSVKQEYFPSAGPMGTLQDDDKSQPNPVKSNHFIITVPMNIFGSCSSVNTTMQSISGGSTQSAKYVFNKNKTMCMYDNDIKTPARKRRKLSGSDQTELERALDGCNTYEVRLMLYKTDCELTNTLITQNLQVLVDRGHAQDTFFEIVDYITSVYVHGEALKVEENKDEFWNKVHPNHQAAIMKDIDDVHECFIKYLSNAICAISELDVAQVLVIFNELLTKINTVNYNLELEQIKQRF